MTMTSDLPYRPCVGVVLINTDGLIFAAERNDTPGAWQMPQGGIDDGESAEDAALRELEEETSVPANAVQLVAQTPDWVTYDLPPELLGKVWNGRFRGQKQHWFLFALTGDEGLIDLDTAHPEFNRWQWMSAADLLEAIVPFKRDVYSQVLGSFAPHLK
ncbi:RNA pyrophosphohydrolase [Oceanibium sediminis]|uniref:RNA pyrophosphohydrolase n=1 Tax=Oceanibium sediminis TaxID=2026339 RepID=UPI000DD4EC3B